MNIFRDTTTTADPAYSETVNPAKPTGWICPVCGRGLSPYTYVCSCKNNDCGGIKIDFNGLISKEGR